MACFHHVAQFLEMLCAAGGRAVREFRQPPFTAEVDVLDLDIGKSLLRIGEEDIDPRVAPVSLLPLDEGIAIEVADLPGEDRLFGEPVRQPRIDADQRSVRSTISSMWRYLRVGLSCSESQIAEPGVVSPRIEPVFGHEPVSGVPSASTASKRKRL